MKWLIIAIVSFSSFQINAQEVQSKSYKLMLNTLLSHSVPELSASKVDTSNQIVWLDAREKNEFAVSKIKNAQWVGYDDFSLDRVNDIQKDEEIVVYCSVGYRSEKVSEQLIEAGFTNVQNLYGGIFEWKNQGNTVVDSTNSETGKVHAFNKAWGVWLKKGKKVYK